MFKPLPLYIALRYFGAKRRNRLVSFISLSSMLGLMLGVAALILVLSVMNGFEAELRGRILGMVPHAALYPASSPLSPSAPRSSNASFNDWRQIAEPLLAQAAGSHGGTVAIAETESGQVTGVAPFVQFEGLLSFGAEVGGVSIWGVEPEIEPSVSIINQHLQDSRLQDLQAGHYRILVGRALASQLGLAIGDKVTVVLPQVSVTLAGLVPRYKRFTVVGYFEVGADIDALFAYVHMADAATLLRMPGQAQALRLRFDDLFAAPAGARLLAEQLSASTGVPLRSEDWTQTHGSLFRAVKIEKTMIAVLLVLIVAVASFNIVSSLVMMVTDKTADIAILRTLGASPTTIRSIFIVQGCLIGIGGSILGVVLGIVAALSITDVVAWLEQVLGTGWFAAYFVDYLPSDLQRIDVALVVTVAFTLSFVATLYPASKAARLEPAEALRYE